MHFVLLHLFLLLVFGLFVFCFWGAWIFVFCFVAFVFVVAVVGSRGIIDILLVCVRTIGFRFGECVRAIDFGASVQLVLVCARD